MASDKGVRYIRVFFLLSTEGSLVTIRAYSALYLGGTPSQETGTGPPSCLLLENSLYIKARLPGNPWVPKSRCPLESQ